MNITAIIINIFAFSCLIFAFFKDKKKDKKSINSSTELFY